MGLGLEQSESSDSVNDVEVTRLFGRLLGVARLQSLSVPLQYVVGDFCMDPVTSVIDFCLLLDFLEKELIIIRDPDKSLKWEGRVWEATSLWFFLLYTTGKQEMP